MSRLLLIRHGTTAATRRALFPHTTGALARADCEPLDGAGRRQVARLAPHLPKADRCWSSLARRTRETAERLGYAAPELRQELAEADFGRWAGASLDEVHAREPAQLSAWFDAPGTAVHGGEPFASLRGRARSILDAARAHDGTTLVTTHGGFIKAVLLELLALPDTAVWRLDVAPCSVTELHRGHDSYRIVRLNWTPGL